jgi:IS30 family transposase
MLTMYKQITIKTLHKQGTKKSQIAHQLGCHRNTVNNVLERKTVSEKQIRVRSSIFDPYKDKIKELTFPYRDFSEYACRLADDTP